MSSYSAIFSSEQLAAINLLPEVIKAKEKLSSSNVQYFTTPNTSAMRSILKTRLGLDTSSVSQIPMRWIKGDTEPHIDSGTRIFENTYLIYLNDSPGQLVLGDTPYPISANTAYVFNEGISHKTVGTGNTPRLLIGPINEFIEPVGGSLNINYYANYADAIAMTNSIAQNASNWVLGTVTSGSIGSYTSWRVAYVSGGSPPSGVYNNGFDLTTIGINSTTSVYPVAPCFLEGTTILCQENGVEKYLPIETLKSGTLVKTSRDGYNKLELLGKGQLQNPGTDERIENRLYKCTPAKYSELKEDLYITGCHSILVDVLTDAERELVIKQNKRVFVTDNKYRLMACIDERAEPWASEGVYTIWHLALENSDPKMNYGIYVNGGLLVETCALNFLKNRTNMTIV